MGVDVRGSMICRHAATGNAAPDDGAAVVTEIGAAVPPRFDESAA